MGVDIHQCEICGHIGEDVSWYESGFYCDDGEECLKRCQVIWQAEDEKEVNYAGN